MLTGFHVTHNTVLILIDRILTKLNDRAFALASER